MAGKVIKLSELREISPGAFYTSGYGVVLAVLVGDGDHDAARDNEAINTYSAHSTAHSVNAVLNSVYLAAGEKHCLAYIRGAF